MTGRPSRIGWVAGAVVVAVSALVWTRLARDGVLPYGTDGAAYLEHLARIRVLEQWGEFEGWNLWAFLLRNDAAFPAMLHLLTLPVGAVFGHSAEVAAATGLGWYLLLAFATGSAAAQVSGKPGAGALGAMGVLLVPSLQGLATRYYFDLPMTALLWLMVALLLITRDRHPVAGGIAAGLLLFVASTIKWAAAPYGAILVIAALVVRSADGPTLRQRWRQRAPAGLLAGAVSGGLIAAYMAGLPETSSFGHQAHITVPDAADLDATGGGLVAVRWAAIEFGDLAFYPLRLVASVVSPLLAAVGLALGVVWIRAGARSASLVVLGAGGIVAFHLLAVPPLDDRFLIPVVPAFVIGAALGFDAIRPDRRTASGAAVLAVAALVAADFHFFPETPLTQPVEVLPERDENSPRTTFRGLGAASSVGQRGWVRADEADSSRALFREVLYQRVTWCRPSCLGARRERTLGGDIGGLAFAGEEVWWKYRSVLDGVTDRGPEELTITTSCSTSLAPLRPCEADLIIERVLPGDPPWLPQCLNPDDWVHVGIVVDPEEEMDASLWRLKDTGVCSDG